MARGTQEHIEKEIAHLKGLDLDGLRLSWRAALGRAAPAHLPKYLLFRLLAYRLQAEAYGEVSRETVLFLESVARTNPGEEDRAGSTVALPRQGRLKPGTVLVREHDGHQHHVMVADNGFAWNGKTYPSLSKVAHAITGTKWNGPRFFGLREKQP